MITAADGTRVPGPNVHWNGRRHGRCQDRRWAASWSPEQIANRLKVDFPDDESMRISHEAIYHALYVQGRGALRRELVACLRTGRALRMPRARTRGRGKQFVKSEIMISKRPAEAEDRAVPGHWEGDLIADWGALRLGPSWNAPPDSRCCCRCLAWMTMGSLESRTVPHWPGTGPRPRDAIASSIITFKQLRRSLTWDQGAEMAHTFNSESTPVCRSTSATRTAPQRGTNENTNGLLRQYFPKGTDLSRHSRDDLDAVAAALNSRPRKTLGWKTPAEVLGDHLCSIKQRGVATTP